MFRNLAIYLYEIHYYRLENEILSFLQSANEYSVLESAKAIDSEFESAMSIMNDCSSASKLESCLDSTVEAISIKDVYFVKNDPELVSVRDSELVLACEVSLIESGLNGKKAEPNFLPMRSPSMTKDEELKALKAEKFRIDRLYEALKKDLQSSVGELLLIVQKPCLIDEKYPNLSLEDKEEYKKIKDLIELRTKAINEYIDKKLSMSQGSLKMEPKLKSVYEQARSLLKQITVKKERLMKYKAHLMVYFPEPTTETQNSPSMPAVFAPTPKTYSVPPSSHAAADTDVERTVESVRNLLRNFNREEMEYVINRLKEDENCLLDEEIGRFAQGFDDV